MKKAEKVKVSSGQILAILETKLWQGTAFAWLREVRNGTGYQRQDRYADALVVSCWPSRGLYASGVEVKVDRQDWLKELKDPEKSAPIQRFCRYWWLATAPGIVRPGELPPTWGLIECDGKKHTVITEAPQLTPDEPIWSFVASVLRNAAQGHESIRSAGEAVGFQKAREKHLEQDARYNEALEKLKTLEALEIKCRNLTTQVDQFQAATGMRLEYYQDGTRAAAAVKMAARLEGFDLERVANRLESEAYRIGEAVKTIRESFDHSEQVGSIAS